ncbi:hypothetical protein KIPB_013585, partial [Kipferlia bialata]
LISSLDAALCEAVMDDSWKWCYQAFIDRDADNPNSYYDFTEEGTSLASFNYQAKSDVDSASQDGTFWRILNGDEVLRIGIRKTPGFAFPSLNDDGDDSKNIKARKTE